MSVSPRNVSSSSRAGSLSRSPNSPKAPSPAPPGHGPPGGARPPHSVKSPATLGPNMTTSSPAVLVNGRDVLLADRAPLLSSLPPEYAEFLQSGKFTDVVLVVEGQKVYAMKAVLAVVSPVFEAMFTTDGLKEYALPEKSLIVVLEMLLYLSPKYRKIISMETVMLLLPLAHEYKIQTLLDDCERCLLTDMESNKENMCVYCKISDRFCLPWLRIVSTLLLSMMAIPDMEVMPQFSEITESTRLEIIRNRAEMLERRLAKRENEEVSLAYLISDRAIITPALCAQFVSTLTQLGKWMAGFEQFRHWDRVFMAVCQREVEQDLAFEVDLEQRRKHVEEAQDDEAKKSAISELEKLASAARTRYVGRLRFVSELHRIGQLPPSVLHAWWARLLVEDDAPLEALAHLVITLGRDLDGPDTRAEMDGYMSRLSELMKSSKLSARVRAMLQDVVFLRQNNWIPKQLKVTTDSEEV